MSLYQRSLLELNSSFSMKDFIYLILETGKEGRKRETINIDVQGTPQSSGSHTTPTGELMGKPGMFPDWESKR